jgi:hypothetical protein
MSRHTTFFELLEAFDQPGCPLCRLTRASTRQYFEALGYEQVNDIDLRAELRTNGLCQPHAWAFLEESGNRLGVAIVYRDLLQQALRGLQGTLSGRLGLGRRLASLLTAGRTREAERSRVSQSCLACRAESEAEARYRSTLLEHLGEPDVRARLAASAGLCLPHLGRSLGSDGSAEDLDWLRQDTIDRLNGLVNELDEYIRKHDYRFRAEPWGEERDAPRRAVERAVGRPRLD